MGVAAPVLSAPEVTSPPRASKGKGKKKWNPTPAQKAAYEAKQAEFDERLKRLGEQMETTTPDQYKAWLTSIPLFYQYSWQNFLLIYLQNPEATRVANFKKWKEQGRAVKKGEKGMAVLVPMVVNSIKRDPKTKQPLLDASGNEIPYKWLTFKPKWGVFDISQTEPIEGASQVDESRRHGGEQCLADLTRAAEELGVPVFLGAVDDPNFPHREELNHLLLTRPNAHAYYVQAKDYVWNAADNTTTKE